MRALNWIENRMNNIEEVIVGHAQILSIDDLKDFTNNILNKFPGQ